MLVLSRRVGEEIVIAGNIRVRVTKIHGSRIRLAVEAPDNVAILRGEVAHRIREAPGEEGTTNPNLADVEQPLIETEWCLP